MTPRYEAPRGLSCPCLPTLPGFDILTSPVCPYCANILAIAKIDTEIKGICRTCPYVCSIGDIASPVPDSDDDNNKIDGNKVDGKKVGSKKVGRNKVGRNKVGRNKVDSNKVDANAVDGNAVNDTNVSS